MNTSQRYESAGGRQSDESCVHAFHRYESVVGGGSVGVLLTLAADLRALGVSVQ